MSAADDAYRQSLRRRPLFTPLYAVISAVVLAIAVVGWLAIGLWQAPATVIVVRHAEKAPGDDPELTPEGQARAEALAVLLASARIDAVYSSGFRRTTGTASPIAERLSLPVQHYDAADTRSLVRRLARDHRSDTVLVVGHSNTVPVIVEGLSGRNVGEIGEDRYGDVFIVTVPRWGRAAVTRLYQTL